MPAYMEVLEYNGAIPRYRLSQSPSLLVSGSGTRLQREGRAPALSLAFAPKTIISISSFAVEKNFKLDL